MNVAEFSMRQLLDAGIHFLIPLIDRVAYIHDLRESAVPIGNQMAVTKDNVTLTIDGVLYYRVEDPYKASYGHRKNALKFVADFF